MLVAISGSQGSGKSTVLKALEEQGYPTVTRKTSRSILDEWDVTLSQVNNDRELTVRFQDEILRRKFDDEKGAFEDKEQTWFTERTFADLATYALIAIGKDNEYSKWMNAYIDRCRAAQQIYDYTFYLPGGMFKVQHDGVRGVNKEYSNMVDMVMKHYTTKWSGDVGLSYMTQTSVNGRVDAIIKIVKELEEEE